MAEANQQVTDSVRVRIPFCGFIPILNVYGPIRSFIPKARVVDLIRSGYEVQIMNPSACPEFAEQLKSYYELLANKKLVEAQQIAKNIIYADNPVARALAEAKAKETEINKSGKGPNNTPIIQAGNAILDAAIANARAAENAQSGNIPGAQANADLQNQLNNIGNGPDAELQNNFLNPQGIQSPEGAPIDLTKLPENGNPGVVTEDMIKSELPGAPGDADIPPQTQQSSEIPPQSEVKIPEVLLPESVENAATAKASKEKPEGIPGTDSKEIPATKQSGGIGKIFGKK